MRLGSIHEYLLVILCYGLLSFVHGDYDYEEEDPRIVGGRPARKGEAFYQLALLHDGSPVCGATLVFSPTSSEQIVVTAAHCAVEFPTSIPLAPEIISLRGDTLHRYLGGQTRNVVKVVTHEEFQVDSFTSDIAILFLDQPFELSPTFKPVDLPVDETDGDTETLTVSGWGTTIPDSPAYAPYLQIVTIPVISNEICAKWYAPYGQEETIMATSICGGEELGGKDSCQADSGGPAIGSDSQGLYLAGIVSWGEGCAVPRTPGVYTRVSQMVNWIAGHTFDYEQSRLGN